MGGACNTNRIHEKLEKTEGKSHMGSVGAGKGIILIWMLKE
jgi:hypothetical protein